MNLTEFGQQCVQFVEALFAPLPGFHTPASGGPLVGTAAQYAQGGPASLAAQGWSQVAPGQLTPGDIIVEQPGTNGVGSAGHVVAVSGIPASGGVEIVQSNSLGEFGLGSPPTVGQLSPAQLDAAGLSAWAPPQGEQQQAAALAQAAQVQLGGGAPSNAPLQTATLTAATSGGSSGGGFLGTSFSWWDPRAYIDAVSGAIGTGVGTATGAAAGAAAGAIVTGVSSASEAVFATGVKPWFRSNVLPLVVGVVIVMILFGGPQKTLEQIQLLAPPGGGNGDSSGDELAEDDDGQAPPQYAPTGRAAAGSPGPMGDASRMAAEGAEGAAEVAPAAAVAA